MNARVATLAVLSAMALVVLEAGMVGVALPTIGHAFAEAPSRAMLVVTAYQLALLAALLPCAHAADRIGYRRLFVGGILLFTASSLLCALAPTLPWLIAARFAQGLGGAAVMALGVALLRVALGPERLGTAIASNALVVALCSAAAPAFGALLLSLAEWHRLFLVPLPMAAIPLIAARALPKVPATIRTADLAGMALYAAAAAALVIAVEAARVAPLAALAAAKLGLACAARLFARDRRRAAPFLPLDLLALRPFRASVTASALLFTGQSAGILALPFYLQLSLGRGAATTGLVIALWPVAVAATSRVASRLAARVAAGQLCAAGGVLLALGLSIAAAWPSVAPLAAASVLCGIGFGLFQVPNNRTLFLTAPASRSAAAGGLQGTARLAGQTAGALLVAAILAAAPIAHAPRLALAAGAVAALAAAWMSRSQNAPETIKPLLQPAPAATS